MNSMNQPGNTTRRRYLRLYTGLLPVILFLALLGGCDKWEDPAPGDHPGLNNPYCNDPEAINYNWGFPGRPNDSVCIYPTDVFKGTYSFRDSIYLPDGSFDSLGSLVTYTLQIHPLTRQKMAITGWCPSLTDSIKMTADRFFRASIDTLDGLAQGQTMCRILDTATLGTLARSATNDTFLTIDFTVVSDTGVRFHRGTAVKQ